MNSAVQFGLNREHELFDAGPHERALPLRWHHNRFGEYLLAIHDKRESPLFNGQDFIGVKAAFLKNQPPQSLVFMRV
jgi:hypothetical protein